MRIDESQGPPSPLNKTLRRARLSLSLCSRCCSTQAVCLSGGRALPLPPSPPPSLSLPPLQKEQRAPSIDTVEGRENVLTGCGRCARRAQMLHVCRRVRRRGLLRSGCFCSVLAALRRRVDLFDVVFGFDHSHLDPIKKALWFYCSLIKH